MGTTIHATMLPRQVAERPRALDGETPGVVQPPEPTARRVDGARARANGTGAPHPIFDPATNRQGFTVAERQRAKTPMWPVAFALKELTPDVEARIDALVRQAVS